MLTSTSFLTRSLTRFPNIPLRLGFMPETLSDKNMVYFRYALTHPPIRSISSNPFQEHKHAAYDRIAPTSHPRSIPNTQMPSISTTTAPHPVCLHSPMTTSNLTTPSRNGKDENLIGNTYACKRLEILQLSFAKGVHCFILNARKA